MNETNIANDMEFFKGKEDPEAPVSEEIGNEEMAGMKLKIPKPIYDKATKCKILDVKFFKNETPEKDKNGTEYIPFFATVSYQEVANAAVEFKETYRGGRLYITPEKTSLYIGPQSAMGKMKIACVESGIMIGNNVMAWAASMKDKIATLKSDTVTWQGKKYDKNYILSIEN